MAYDKLQIERYDEALSFSWVTEGKVLDDTVAHSPAGDGRYVTSFRFITQSGKIKDTIDELEEYLMQAVEYHRNPARVTSWWYVEETDKELVTKRALVHGYELRRVNSPAFHGDLSKPFTLWDIAITRGRFEDAIATTATTTGVNATGGTWDLTGTTGGRYDARIAELRVEPDGAAIFDAVWLGIKPVIDETSLSTFDPVIDAGVDYGSPLGSDTTDTGTDIQVTFATTATMAIRAYYPFSSWAGGGKDWEVYAGRYVVLLRMKYSDTSTSCGIQMRVKGSASDHETQFATQYPPADANWSDHWRLVPLGELQFGPNRNTDPYRDDTDWQQFRLQIYAERNAGSGNLVFSHIILIPAEHYAATDQEIDIGLTWTEYLYIRTHADESTDMNVAVQSNSRRVSSPEPELRNWTFPRKGGVLVFAGHQYAFDQSTSFAADFRIELNKRWGNYRE